jgi:hypothetical protein
MIIWRYNFRDIIFYLKHKIETVSRKIPKNTLLYRGKKYKDYLICLALLADILTLEGKDAEALPIYEKVLIHLQKEYPYEEDLIAAIISKMTTLYK